MSNQITPAVKAVWTDFGGVLTPPISHTLNAFCEQHDVDAGVLTGALWTVTQRYGTNDIMLPLDTPLVTEDEWLAQVKAELRTKGVELEVTSLADAWFGGREANEKWVRRLREARSAGLFIGLLSNMVPAWDAHWRRMVPPEDLFDQIVLSFEVGHRKPAEEIFRIAEERSGIPASASIFVDDLEKNVTGARAAGWRAIHFTDTDEAVTALDEALGGVR